MLALGHRRAIGRLTPSASAAPPGCTCCTHLNSESFEPFISQDNLKTFLELDNWRRSFKNPMVGSQDGSKLQSLPIEIYHLCLQQLDIATLTTLRRVSQYTRSAIDSIPQYKELYEHAPQALRACLFTGVAPHIPLLRLHNSLTNMQCWYCQTESSFTFGAYLSLFKGRRCCLSCLRNNDVLRPVQLKDVLHLCFPLKATIKPDQIGKVPQLRIMPGHYGVDHTWDRKNLTVLLRSQSLTSPTNPSLSDAERKVLFGSMRVNSVFHHPFVKAENEANLTLDNSFVDPDGALHFSHRYATGIQSPYLNASKTKTECGIFCEDCILNMLFQEQGWKAEPWNRGPARKAAVNKSRELAATQYTMTEEALDDAKIARTMGEGNLPEDFLAAAKEPKATEFYKVGGIGMSIQEHRLTHIGWKLGTEEREFRKGIKGSPLPLLAHKSMDRVHISRAS